MVGQEFLRGRFRSVLHSQPILQVYPFELFKHRSDARSNLLTFLKQFVHFATVPLQQSQSVPQFIDFCGEPAVIGGSLIQFVLSALEQLDKRLNLVCKSLDRFQVEGMHVVDHKRSPETGIYRNVALCTSLSAAITDSIVVRTSTSVRVRSLARNVNRNARLIYPSGMPLPS